MKKFFLFSAMALLVCGLTVTANAQPGAKKVVKKSAGKEVKEVKVSTPNTTDAALFKGSAPSTNDVKVGTPSRTAAKDSKAMMPESKKVDAGKTIGKDLGSAGNKEKEWDAALDEFEYVIGKLGSLNNANKSHQSNEYTECKRQADELMKKITSGAKNLTSEQSARFNNLKGKLNNATGVKKIQTAR